MRFVNEIYDKHGTKRFRSELESNNIGRHFISLARSALCAAAIPLLVSCNSSLPLPFG